jgi:hypothetical protein
VFLRNRVQSARRVAGAAALAIGMTVAVPAQAYAQGLFEALFGGLRRASQQMHLPSRTTSFADPFGLDERRPAARSGGGGQAYCVRTCDGRFFPVQRQGSMSVGEVCKSFCPTSNTMVFYGGGKIDHAVSGNTRYSDLPNAFVYRQRLVDNCTCNGRDPVGLARVDLKEDATLRPGDIVATNDGLATYRGQSRDKQAQFTPINPSAGEWARRLAETEVVPAAQPVQKIEPLAEQTGTVPGPQRVSNRSVQLAR